jgi:mono/diheme cytochrome c family protein
MAEEGEARYSGGEILEHVAPGKVRKWSAVNLTSSKQGLASWSEKELAQYLRTGFSLRAGTFGPMNEVITNSLKHLTPADAAAMATYIKSVPSHDYAGEPVFADAAAQGAAIYKERCEKCHGESGRGGMFNGPPLAGSAATQSADPASLLNLILYGQDKAPGVSFGAWEAMPAYESILDDSQIAAVSNFVRASWGNRASAVTAEQVARQR